MAISADTYTTRSHRWLYGLALLLFLAAYPLFARAPAPALRIPLDSVGFEPQTEQFLLAGSSMLTLHYVDNQHLLLTFGVHRLMERIANDPADDEDRMVEAVLLEVPSGRVLARTDWRFHDSGQYLWSLGHGQFLLRVRGTLTTFAPVTNLKSGQPFRQQPFLTTPRRIGAVLLSPEDDLLVIESVEKTPPVPEPRPPLFGPAPKPAPAPLGEPGDPDPVALSFYRLSASGTDGGEIRPILAGVARADRFGNLPATGTGHLTIVDLGQQHWAFDFHPFHGHVNELSPFDSSCRPSPQFVSGSEFVSFGCHGGSNPQVLGGFNMRGEEMWEQNLFGDFVTYSFAFAPLSGRFALERVLGEMPPVDDALAPPEAFTGESVAIYQTESGRQLLHVDCSPIERAGQNFTLSPDGMNLAVIRAGAIEIYALPPLSAKDQADVKEARALMPEKSLLPIDFAEAKSAPESVAQPESSSSSAAPADANAPSAAATAPAATATATATAADAPSGVKNSAANMPPAASNASAGDAAPEQPRKPPTLYTLPTDPENNQAK